ncbi:translation initiation factor IF-2-like [Ochotona curzoniae]|uniref:translation initiation factor IF-2-like n=1 Tax=Ochotona curzoniae TaxID=130825 RepID=UPI001B34E95D|nr:translation initiation factor IF-2-like [Ochotona curzoniae]
MHVPAHSPRTPPRAASGPGGPPQQSGGRSSQPDPLSAATGKAGRRTGRRSPTRRLTAAPQARAAAAEGVPAPHKPLSLPLPTSGRDAPRPKKETKGGFSRVTYKAAVATPRAGAHPPAGVCASVHRNAGAEEGAGGDAAGAGAARALDGAGGERPGGPGPAGSGAGRALGAGRGRPPGWADRRAPLRAPRAPRAGLGARRAGGGARAGPARGAGARTPGSSRHRKRAVVGGTHRKCVTTPPTTRTEPAVVAARRELRTELPAAPANAHPGGTARRGAEPRARSPSVCTEIMPSLPGQVCSSGRCQRRSKVCSTGSCTASPGPAALLPPGAHPKRKERSRHVQHLLSCTERAPLHPLGPAHPTPPPMPAALCRRLT